MEINFVLSKYASLHENMVAKVYETTAPLVEVDSFIIIETDAAGIADPGGGHNKQATVVFTGLDLVPHILRLYTQSGTLLQQFNTSPSAFSVTVYADIYFEIGDGGVDTPLAGDSSYVNTDLAGLENGDLVVHRSGVLMYPGKHYNVDVTGGFSLVVPFDVFGDEEEFRVERKPTSSGELVNDSVVGKQWGPSTGLATMFLDVTTNVNFAATHLRKLIRLSGTGQYHFTTAPPLGYPFRFVNMVSGNPVIYFDVANLIQPGGDVASIVLPTGGIIEVVYDGTKFNLTMNNSDSLGNMPYGSITHMGVQALGNIGAPPYNVSGVDSVFTITIPDQGTTAYKVAGSLIGLTPDPNIDNDCSYSVAQKTATSFKLAVRKYGNVVTNINFEYVIVKAN